MNDQVWIRVASWGWMAVAGCSSIQSTRCHSRSQKMPHFHHSNVKLGFIHGWEFFQQSSFFILSIFLWIWFEFPTPRSERPFVYDHRFNLIILNKSRLRFNLIVWTKFNDAITKMRIFSTKFLFQIYKFQWINPLRIIRPRPSAESNSTDPIDSIRIPDQINPIPRDAIRFQEVETALDETEPDEDDQSTAVWWIIGRKISSTHWISLIFRPFDRHRSIEAVFPMDALRAVDYLWFLLGFFDGFFSSGFLNKRTQFLLFCFGLGDAR